jgi:hypothetical protein
MEWTMFYLFVALKVPILAACWIIWWAIRAEPDPSGDEPRDDGGAKHRPPVKPPAPRGPRRGPHGEPAPASPARVRTPARARGRTPSS